MKQGRSKFCGEWGFDPFVERQGQKDDYCHHSQVSDVSQFIATREVLRDENQKRRVQHVKCKTGLAQEHEPLRFKKFIDECAAGDACDQDRQQRGQQACMGYRIWKAISEKQNDQNDGR